MLLLTLGASMMLMAGCFVDVVLAFQTPMGTHQRHYYSRTPIFVQRQHLPIIDGSYQNQIPKKSTMIFSTPNESGDDEEDSNISGGSSSSSRTAAVVEEDESQPYPIDLPSPLLLASSMILAIVGTGSVFDLANESPRFGAVPTVGIAAVSLTLCAGLFWASILKATAETEADDENYMRGN
eukprot:CAMPEP_0113483014 /NCGR_PEP_ID=MMETSP0014_2-20120614/23216_1 /TAXON_ID=2857 /ORGANISM="Nitzschia sp." /LENGTH=180 /DNA_ID=CAMNT_0000376549 /DNA_START=51 /DNA_END=593 /DNA_ORIENTATION=- /assembly_acc=CAM_ASM_000159